MALFDSRPVAGWHTPLLYPGVRMQTGWMKDLVSLVDPRHELTFLNYLVTSGRLYALINSQFDSLPRIEYERYLAWATERLGVVNFSSRVDAISITDQGFEITVGGEPVAVSEHLVLGLGTRPVWPDYVRGLPRERAFIADELGARRKLWTARSPNRSPSSAVARPASSASCACSVPASPTSAGSAGTSGSAVSTTRRWPTSSTGPRTSSSCKA